VAQLICLPHAGAGASAYLGWQPKLEPRVEVLPARLPGREARFAEPPVRSVGELVDGMLGAVLERVRGPIAIFGHSMGALIAYELAHALAAQGEVPVHLFVSGYAAPHLPLTGPALHSLPDQDFLDHISTLQGTSSEVLEHPELMQLLGGVLKADYELCETYRHQGRAPIPVPITALGGADDPDTRGERLTRWAELSTAPCTARWFSGGHFYLHNQVDELMSVITETLLGSRSTTGE